MLILYKNDRNVRLVLFTKTSIASSTLASAVTTSQCSKWFILKARLHWASMIDVERQCKYCVSTDVPHEYGNYNQFLDRICCCWCKHRRMVAGSFILAREQKRHRFQVGSWRIQFTVHIEQWQRSKKKIHVLVRFRFFQCKWTLTQHLLGTDANAQYKRTLAMCFKIQLCSCYKIQTKARLLHNTRCISESSIKCMQVLFIV